MTTLAEELEEAAQLADGAGRKTGTLDSITEGNHFAARLRLRAEAVKSGLKKLADTDHDDAWWFRDVVDEFTGAELDPATPEPRP